jgi:hypothetical protein
MSATVWLGARALGYPEGGGHFWVYLNWALGLRAAGCRVVWLETADPQTSEAELRRLASCLRDRLRPHGLSDRLAIAPSVDGPHPPAIEGCLDVSTAGEADGLLNLNYGLPPGVVGRFRKSALLDIDPGLLQIWISSKQIRLADYDLYLTTGETVGRPDARFPDAGRRWLYTPPCVATDYWQPHPAPAGAPFTTVSHWFAEEWVVENGQPYRNDKRAGFLPYLDLPRMTTQPLELALCTTAGEEAELDGLRNRGWRVRHAYEVAATPEDYQAYVRDSRGEFSCAKPSCVRLQNAWVSDRTLCYLASGKPAVVQHTGPSRILPENAGLVRFHTPEEAVRGLEAVAADYDRHSRQARALAEEVFDARKVVRRVLELALN